MPNRFKKGVPAKRQRMRGAPGRGLGKHLVRKMGRR